MRVNSDCIGCEDCLPYCPQGAISMNAEAQATIDRSLCVECGVCFDTDICPVLAFEEDHDDLAELKKLFGRLLATFPGGKASGRSGGQGYDVKTNDVTGKIAKDRVGMRFELGRPVGGLKIRDVERMRQYLVECGWQPGVGARYRNLVDEGFSEEMLDHRILTSFFEFVLFPEDIPDLVHSAKQYIMGNGLWMTVNVVGLTQTMERVEKVLKSAGLDIEPVAKVNLGMGRRI